MTDLIIFLSIAFIFLLIIEILRLDHRIKELEAWKAAAWNDNDE